MISMKFLGRAAASIAVLGVLAAPIALAADEPSATIKFHGGSVAFIAGVHWGSGDLYYHGKRIPLNAHIRLANPRTAQTANQRILRRGYNYDRGIDEAGNLDQGLAFVAFNQDIQRQFATIQGRLNEEEMTDYITPVGGGYFFAPRGSSGPGDWVGSPLFA